VEDEDDDMFSAYIPSFIPTSTEKTSVVIEESLQVDDLEDDEDDLYTPLPIKQSHTLNEEKVVEEIETLEFDEEEEEERTEIEEDDQSSSILNFMMFLAKSQPNPRNQQILYEYLSQKTHSMENTVESFQPERLFTEVEEFAPEEE